MRSKKILLFSFFVVFFFCCFINNNNKVYAADPELYEDFLIDNGNHTLDALDGMTYVVVNHTWQDQLVIYFTSDADAQFVFSDETTNNGDKIRYLTLSNGSKNIGFYNISRIDSYPNDSSYINRFRSCEGVNLRSLVGNAPSNISILNASVDNVLYSSGSFVLGSETITGKKVLPRFGTLGRIVARTNTQMALQQIIQILPLILVVVVSFLGLRKALRMLSTLLRAS